MPRYDYACPECGYTETHVHRMDGEFHFTCANEECPYYDEALMEKQIGTPHVNVKGGTPIHHRRNR